MMALTVLLAALCMKESVNKPAPPDPVSQAAGYYMIKPIFVKDVNRILKRQEFTLADRFDKVRATQMARIWFRHYEKPEWTKQDYILSFKMGVKGYRKAKSEGKISNADLVYADDVLNLMEKYESER